MFAFKHTQKNLPNLTNIHAGSQHVETASTMHTTYGRQQMSLLIELSKGHLRANRGPAVAALDCIKGHLESVAALRHCLSFPLCPRQQVGRVLTCLLSTRENTPVESQSSAGG